MIKQSLITLLKALKYRFKPYKVQERQVSCEEVTSLCTQVSESYQTLGLVNSFSLYRKVVDILISNPKVNFKPLSDLMDPVPEGQITVALRHDIDADIVTGLQAARFLASRGVPGSFYLLHTSQYYGAIEGDVFYRHSSLGSFVESFIATGCEIGLHTDPLHFYCNHCINGLQAIRSELEWMRTCGAIVKGTVAHNSAVVYGAENFEIFRGKAVAGRSEIMHDGRSVPLQLIDEHQLGLTYEGNFPVLPDRLDGEKVNEYIRLSRGDGVRNKEWLELYFLHNPYFDRLYDVDIWLLGIDVWAMALRDGGGQLLWPVPTDDMLSKLNELGNEMRVVINIHPEYVSGVQ